MERFIVTTWHYSAGRRTSIADSRVDAVRQLDARIDDVKSPDSRDRLRGFLEGEPIVDGVTVMSPDWRRYLGHITPITD